MPQDGEVVRPVPLADMVRRDSEPRALLPAARAADQEHALDLRVRTGVGAVEEGIVGRVEIAPAAGAAGWPV